MGAAALHAGVTPVTCFTLGFIFSSHLDEEITCSSCMKRMALPARTEQVFVLDDSPNTNKEQPALTLSCYRWAFNLFNFFESMSDFFFFTKRKKEYLIKHLFHVLFSPLQVRKKNNDMFWSNSCLAD